LGATSLPALVVAVPLDAEQVVVAGDEALAIGPEGQRAHAHEVERDALLRQAVAGLFDRVARRAVADHAQARAGGLVDDGGGHVLPGRVVLARQALHVAPPGVAVLAVASVLVVAGP